MYGNNYSEQPHKTRLFPYLLSKLCDYFSFEDCRFSNQLCKESTARVAMWRELNIPNVFTMESSFCGADRGELCNKEFGTQDLILAGEKVLLCLLVYFKIDFGPQIQNFTAKNRALLERHVAQRSERRS
jgi:hypothetical protein